MSPVLHAQLLGFLEDVVGVMAGHEELQQAILALRDPATLARDVGCIGVRAGLAGTARLLEFGELSATMPKSVHARGGRGGKLEK